MINKYHNQQYSSGIPLRTGDRRYSQDRVRDFWFLMDMLGLVASDIFGILPVLLSGGIVTQGSGANLDITSGLGYTKFSVTIPDSFSSLPPSTTSEDLEAIRVAWTSQNDMNASSSNCSVYSITDDGMTVHYVKVRYKETDGNSRNKAKASGSYAYETVPDFDFVVDSVTPTDYDIVLTTFTSSGGVYTFSDYEENKILYDNLLNLSLKCEEYDNHIQSILYTSLTQIGSDFSVSGSSTYSSSVTRLNHFGLIAFIDGYNDDLSTYQWNGETFTLIGSALSVSGTNHCIKSLSSSLIAHVDETNLKLGAYYWNGSVWALLGSEFTLPTDTYNVAGFSMARIDAEHVALIDGQNGKIRVYYWNGSVWTQAGNTYTTGSDHTSFSLTELIPGLIIMEKADDDTLTALGWDGTDFIVIGTPHTIDSVSSVGPCHICALNDTDFLVVNTGTVSSAYAIVYRWNGNTFEQVSIASYYGVSSVPNTVGICPLNGTDVVFSKTYNSGKVQVFRIGMAPFGQPNDME